MEKPETVFITGVSSGIGLGLAAEYLRRGCRVGGVSRRAPRELLNRPGFYFRSVDLASFEAIDERIPDLFQEMGRVDLVVLNAGILGGISDLAATTVEEMKRVMDVNCWANKILLDTIFSTGPAPGQVVGISSGAAVRALRGWGAYAISKAALNMLLALYAAENPATHFCALAPGIVDTPIQERIAHLPADPRFPSIESLKAARGTASMPSPEIVAPRLIEAISLARERPSGSSLDLRELVN